jgi:hypothetical protein
MSDFIQGDPEKLLNGCIGRRHAIGVTFIRQGFQYAFQKFVTNSHIWLEIFAPTSGIHLLAFRRLDGQLFR